MIIKLQSDYSKYEPIGSGVIVSIARSDVNEMVATEGGVLVPKDQDRRDNPIQECVVVARGPDCKQVHAGDRVLFNLGNAPAMPVGDLEMRMTQESYLICITKKTKKEDGLSKPVDSAPVPDADRL